MNRKLLAFLIAASILVGGKPFTALAQTDEPTPEATPIVVESEPVVIPDDSTVIVVEVPETPEPAPVPTVNPDLQALLIAGVSLAILAVFSVFGSRLIAAAKDNVPPWALEPIFSAVDSILATVESNALATTSTADDAQVADLRKKYEELKTELRNKTEPGK